jgi:hypothetical protein
MLILLPYILCHLLSCGYITSPATFFAATDCFLAKKPDRFLSRIAFALSSLTLSYCPDRIAACKGKLSVIKLASKRSTYGQLYFIAGACHS